MSEQALTADTERMTGAASAARPGVTFVDTLTRQLAEGNLEAIQAFGRGFGAAASELAQDILTKVGGRDLALIGGKLVQIVGVAKTLDLHGLSRGRAAIPLLGPLLDRLRGGIADLSRCLQRERPRIDGLISEVAAMRADLEASDQSLDLSHAAVRAALTAINRHLSAADRAIESLNRRLGEIAEQPTGKQSQFTAQALRGALRSLDKRIADIKGSQHSVLQQLAMIRMVQANNRLLIDECQTICELTVPAWKRQFIVALSLNESPVSTAGANRRLDIDIDTLRQVHDSLVSTIEAVVAISEEGGRQRASISQALQDRHGTLAGQPAARTAPRAPVTGRLAEVKGSCRRQ